MHHKSYDSCHGSTGSCNINNDLAVPNSQIDFCSAYLLALESHAISDSIYWFNEVSKFPFHCFNRKEDNQNFCSV